MLHYLTPWVQLNDHIEDITIPLPNISHDVLISTDISTAMKEDTAKAHLLLLNDLHCNQNTIIVYTDGSQTESAPSASSTIPFQLPTIDNAIILIGNTAEVFNAEVCTIHECLLTHLKYSWWHTCKCWQIDIFTDNQAAIMHASQLRQGPGQDLAHLIHDATNDLKEFGATITIH